MSYTLETQRLKLKPISQGDLENIWTLRSDAEVMQYIFDGHTWEKQETKDWLEQAIDYFNRHKLGFFSVFDKQSENFVGQAGIFYVGPHTSQPMMNIAYLLHREHWGAGYATELAHYLIQYSFNHFNPHQIIAAYHPQSLASIRVLEKVGMRYGGLCIQRGEERPYHKIQKGLFSTKPEPMP